MEVVISNIVLWLLSIIIPIIGAFACKAINYLAEKYKMDAYVPEFEKIIQEGVDFGEKIAIEFLGDASVDIENETIATALEYVNNNGPKLAKKLGFSQEQLTDKIEAKLNEL